MRGRGRVYRQTSGYTGDTVATWSLDYTVNGKRYRESSGMTVKPDAVDELERRIKLRQNGQSIEPAAPKKLKEYVEHHLAAKAIETDKHGLRRTERWLAGVKRQLNRAIAYFGADRLLGSISADDVVRWIAALRSEGMQDGTVRHHINSLSNLYRRAHREELVNDNPVARLLPTEKPKAGAEEAHWLEVPEAALLLEAAKAYQPQRDDLGMPFAYPLIATFLLTGGRAREVLGLEVDDVNPKLRKVFFRPNEWRRLKTKKSKRDVPLWPQLEEILRDYLYERKKYVLKAGVPQAKLLFPSFRTGQEAMLTDFRKLLDAVAKLAGLKAGDITPKMFRHTYISARIQTTQNGKPVAAFQVAKEVGHSSTAMIENVYGHLGDTQHRSKHVEYRTEQHRQAIRALVKQRKITARSVLRLVA
jgi:integrase